MLISRNDPLEHGDLAALICLNRPEIQAIVIEQLSLLGFNIHTALNQEEMELRLHEHIYEIVAVETTFAGGNVESNIALDALALLPLDQRRHCYVILIGPEMEDRSEMQAFRYGVDLTLREETLDQLKTIAGRGIVKQESLYAAFHAVRKLAHGV